MATIQSCQPEQHEHTICDAALSTMSSRVSTSSSHTHVDPPRSREGSQGSPLDKKLSLLPQETAKHVQPLSRAFNDQDLEKSGFQNPALQPQGSFFSDPFLVDWKGSNDPEHPLNWSAKSRWFITTLSGILILNATFGSSAPSGIGGSHVLL